MAERNEYSVQFDEARDLAEAFLYGCFMGDGPQVQLYEAMRYSLLAGGKRIRPVLTLEFAEAVGGDMKEVLPVACAVEMLHTYSLIHDDLPCMDNDVLRRGRPTNHVVYGECVATLAGDALQAAAFSTLLSAKLPADRLCLAAKILAEAAGEDGMCAGQVLDMDGENRSLSLDEVRTVHHYKTAALIRGACMMGVAAGGGTPEQMEAAGRYADAIGLAFQIRDDMLDVTSTEQEMGKSVRIDMVNGKSTFASILGLEECARIVDEQTAIAEEEAAVFDNAGFFRWFARKLANRKN